MEAGPPVGSHTAEEELYPVICTFGFASLASNAMSVFDPGGGALVFVIWMMVPVTWTRTVRSGLLRVPLTKIDPAGSAAADAGAIAPAAMRARARVKLRCTVTLLVVSM